MGSEDLFDPRKSTKITFEFARELKETAYWENLRSKLHSAQGNEKVVLVFIHGYNTSFVEAARRTAQLWADLRLTGIPAFFSWPSKARVFSYTVDEATVDYSEKYLREFLTRLRQEVGDTQPIHLIAHSMGNRALLRVAETLQGKLRFGQIILAAPDVDADLFQDMAQVYPKISERTTLYVSKADKPVNFSRHLHDVGRVGAPPKFARVQGIDTVEVVAKTGLLQMGHSYFAEFNDLLDDMELLLKKNPATRHTVFGRRLDRRAQCASVGEGATRESCWRLVADK
ncbi:Alpha/beta hydrolase of unknown function [Paracidovorax cattleyae]|uniref:Esterase/lipase superfamily enzyme n=2 Tax=Paracidovorax cattleyae TaxID=80868 RepID=A0A1H0LJW5_9BURK|nr:Alpha/beta hydrolase of unknown function [Paracidovorax cattleyae]